MNLPTSRYEIGEWPLIVFSRECRSSKGPKTDRQRCTQHVGFNEQSEGPTVSLIMRHERLREFTVDPCRFQRILSKVREEHVAAADPFFKHSLRQRSARWDLPLVEPNI